ncbi:hypothetical protein EAI_13181 [Harpegnathos saltator]|uniref:Uncharacterized protein n=1 Tax=Harpegnathos saltator TaxID=610380 RepID=E2BIJ6_HARSA|nr:hypothetical protein EAI_13181 [Harpegnathos saltator]
MANGARLMTLGIPLEVPSVEMEFFVECASSAREEREEGTRGGQWRISEYNAGGSRIHRLELVRTMLDKLSAELLCHLAVSRANYREASSAPTICFSMEERAVSTTNSRKAIRDHEPVSTYNPSRRFRLPLTFEAGAYNPSGSPGKRPMHTISYGASPLLKVDLVDRRRETSALPAEQQSFFLQGKEDDAEMKLIPPYRNAVHAYM